MKHPHDMNLQNNCSYKCVARFFMRIDCFSDTQTTERRYSLKINNIETLVKNIEWEKSNIRILKNL